MLSGCINNKKWIRISFIIFVLLWILSIIYFMFLFTDFDSTFKFRTNCDSLIHIVNNLKIQVKSGTQNLIELIDLVNKQKSNNERISLVSKFSLGYSHETLRRRASRYAREIYYTSSRFNKIITELKESVSKGQEHVDKTLSYVTELQHLQSQYDDISLHLEVDLDGLGRVDGAVTDRVRQLNILSKYVQNRIDKLQNPLNCDSSKYIVAKLSRPCAFGCNAHHLLHCFQMAYATGRTLLLDLSIDSYTKWWRDNFLPLSNTCHTFQVQPISDYSSTSFKQVQAIMCPYIGEISTSFSWIPPAIPNEIAENLTRVHGAPFVWFAGQLANYLMRPNDGLKKFVQTSIDSINVRDKKYSPIVGLHVRRTDKINTEASRHDLEEYMIGAERFFQFIDKRRQIMSRTNEWQGDENSEFQKSLQLNPVKRRVFLATDEPSLFAEAKKKYTNYEFYGDVERADSADPIKRSESNSIRDVVIDIITLSHTDYLVCTFSSQVCRLAYELMQARYEQLGDASELFRSLDDIYYFGGQQSSPYEVIIQDIKSNLRYGDLVHMAGNHWDGNALVSSINQPEKRVLIPAYKISPRVLIANFSEN